MQQATRFYRSLSLLLILNALVKPVWVFLVDRKVQLLTGDAYGDYFSLLHLSLIPAVIADAGILSFYTRSVAADPSTAPTRFRYFLRIKIILSLLYVCAVSVLSAVFAPAHIKTMLLLALLQVAASFYLFFRSHISALQLFHTDALFSVADKLLVILVAGSILYLPFIPVSITTTLFIQIQLLAFVVAGAAALIFLAPHLQPGIKHKLSMPLLKNELKNALPYAAVVLLMTILYRFDAFLLYRLHPNGQQEAAIYAGGFRLLDALNMAGFLVASFLLPFLSRNSEKQMKQEVVKTCTALLLVYSSIAAGFCLFNYEWVCDILYGRFYAGAAPVIAGSVLAIVGTSMVHIYSSILTAAGKIKTLATSAGIFAGCNIIVNIFCIPVYGALGTAVISAISQVLFAIVLIITCYYKNMPVPGKKNWLIMMCIPIPSFALFCITRFLSPGLQLIVVTASIIIITLGLKIISLPTLKAFVSARRTNR
jgi:O-antigen/teichoic acid export membrane protein